ncbi:MAG: DUF4921 family protein [Candidatus Bathyarchaeia archaeon]
MRNRKSCVFCPGNERLTPSPVYIVGRDGNLSRASKAEKDSAWLIRVVPNFYPAVYPDTRSKAASTPGAFPAVGHHEIIVESPRHFQRIQGMGLAHLQAIIRAYRDRVEALSTKAYVNYVSVFRNYGKEAGASQRHPHSQLVTLPFTPPTIAQEVARFKTSLRDEGACPLCELSGGETKPKSILWEGERFTVVCPLFSAYPYETWIVPNRHEKNFQKISVEETGELSPIIKSLFHTFSQVLNDPPHNLWIHTSPREAEDFHWHIEAIPRLGEVGGLEMSTAVHVNTLLPEDAASNLRRCFASRIKRLGFNPSHN